MANDSSGSRILMAIDALNALDRRKAAALIREDLAAGAPSGERWRNVGKLADTIGEINLAINAARRYAETMPQTLERILHYYGELSKFGRASQAIEEAEGLPSQVLAHPAILHFRGVVATQTGDFERAEQFLRRAIDLAPITPQTWFALTMVKTFAAGDPDIATMEGIRPEMRKAPREAEARFLYGLGKAYEDTGDTEKAFLTFCEGAAIMRGIELARPTMTEDFAKKIAAEFSADRLSQLRPSRCDSERVIFVTGLPRSGSTLVEHILTSHSAVGDGAELSLLQAALIPTGNYSHAGGLAYQTRNSGSADPWGELAHDYLGMVASRFSTSGRIVDKTLGHGRFMGLLMHKLPKAKVIWLRRNPEDAALSCFRTFFTINMPWTWSITDIAAHFRAEDILFSHWMTLFPDRILPVPYEKLVEDPKSWVDKILRHAGLDAEQQTLEPHKNVRTVMTASVVQVRNPISTSSIGKAKAYSAFIEPFRAAYYKNR